MKALVVAHNSRFIAQFELNNIRLLQSLGYEVHCATDFENEVMLPDAKVRIANTGAIIHQFPIARLQWKPSVFFRNFVAYRHLKRILADDFDLIHCHTPMGGVVARLAARGARKRGTKVIYTAHRFHFFKGAPLLNWLLYFPVEWLLAHFTDVVVTINQEDYSRAQKFPARKVCYVPGVGIDTTRFTPNKEIGRQLRTELGIDDDAFVLLSVGEVNVNKNHQVIVRALPKLHNVKYVICGNGPMEDDLRGLATELGVSDRLMLAGFRNDVNRFYQMADCFVFPSLREGLSVALMEAMGCETPVACSKIRGNTDLIENGVTGYIFENNADCIAELLQYIMTHDDERRTCAEAARKKLQQFDVVGVTEQLRAIYIDALENR